MANDIHKITGKAYWARVLGAPAKAYNPEEREWTIDVSLDNETVARMSGLGLGAGIKTKGDARGVFYTFKRREFKKKDGKPNQPISVKDADGTTAWPKEILLGNGTVVEVTFKIFEVAAFAGKKAHNKDAILEVKVLEHVPYEKKEGKATFMEAGHSWKGDVV